MIVFGVFLIVGITYRSSRISDPQKSFSAACLSILACISFCFSSSICVMSWLNARSSPTKRLSDLIVRSLLSNSIIDV